ncbi:MAG: hypothetical protein J6X67_11690 [Treponema sp.]|nr:hypothetical protein [Treponema sp.]
MRRPLKKMDKDKKQIYNMFPKCRNKLIKMDESYENYGVDFSILLAVNSEDTGLKSKEGREIRLSYEPWHDVFMSSTDRKNGKYLKELCCNTGAMCFPIFDTEKQDYTYIVAMNKDVYDCIPSPIYKLILAHELGHALSDHPFIKSKEREIKLELEADNNGFNLLISHFKEDKSIFDSDMICATTFKFMHAVATPTMAYGSKGIDLIQKKYRFENRLAVWYYIASSLVDLDSNESDAEVEIRSKNYKEWLLKA